MKLLLKYILLIQLLNGCSNNTSQSIAEPTQLFTSPVTVALNTTTGYTINKFTGDSIKPILNSFGDTVITGKPIPFKGVTVNAAETINPEVIHTKIIQTIPVPGNVLSLPKKPTIIEVDTNQLKKTKLNEGDTSIIPTNIGNTITGKPFAVTGKKIPWQQPIIIKALPMASKENATHNIEYLDVDQGMSFSYVNDLLEDKDGNLWFCTDGEGISKYDGLNFIHYTQKQGLTGNTTRAILQDKTGNIWIATKAGLSKFDGETFTQYTTNEGLLNNNIWCLMEDAEGNIWIGTDGGGATKFDGKNFTHYTTKEGLINNKVYSILQDKKGNIWFATRGGVSKFDGEKFIQFDENSGLRNINISSMMCDKNGYVWFGTYNGACKFDGEKIIYYTKADGLTNYTTSSLLEDKNGNIWMSTPGAGLNKFDGKTFTNYNIHEGITNNKVRKMIEDHNGNIWFGTDGGGVNKLNETGFSHLIEKGIFNNSRVRPIFSDNIGNLWFGTEAGGLYTYDGKKITSYNTNVETEIEGLRSIMQDKNGTIWFSKTDNGGLFKFDGKTFTHYTTKQGLSSNFVMCIAEDSKGIIWIATYDGGINSFNGKTFTRYTEKEGLSSNKILSIFIDTKKNLWLATEGGGASKYDGKYITHYTEKEGLSDNNVTSVLEDKNGNTWFTTMKSGVNKFDEKIFTYYTENQGLSNNGVWSIIEDKESNIWIGTDKGLNLMKPNNIHQQTNYKIYSFGLKDGLKGIDFNLRSACIDNQNRMWWGTGKTLVTLDLNKKIYPSDIHSLRITNMDINEQAYDYSNFSGSEKKKNPFENYPDSITLSYNQNHLTFHFVAIDWSAPQKIKYSYRLAGLDNHWSKPTEEPKADYRNLSYGTYTFEVKAIGESQVWTNAASYNFTILPAWWQTWWFKSLAIIFSALALLFISRLIYLSRLRKQKTLMEKQLAVQIERQRISSEMHDDIGAGLSGIKLMTEITKKKFKDNENVYEIDRIYQSLGDISAKMKEVIWSLNAENDNLPSLISYIQKQVRLWLEHYPCQLMMDVPDNVPFIEISGEARRNILLLTKEAVHNIIKHSGADKVSIIINYRNQLIITVTDNGKGLNENEKNNNSGNGMKNMRRRIEQLKGNLLVKNKNGLKLIFEIPIKSVI